jgi:DNA polymerase III subunit alpha
MKFSHLHNHTQYSLLDGASSIKKLFDKAVADNMPALAITDHGNMFGVFDFVATAKKYKNDDGTLKVKPIIGCEFYMVENREKRSFTKDLKDVRHHQLLLAKNETGYKNLTKLCSLGYTEGMYGKYPRIDKSILINNTEGLIATTCCLGAVVPQLILKKGEAEAEIEFKWWLDVFGKDYYVELQRHGIPEQEVVNEVLMRFAEKYNVPIIASNDSHYVDEADSNAHDILLCVNTGEKQSTPGSDEVSDDDVDVKNKRFKFFNNQFFLKSTVQMMETFADLPQAIDNTNLVISTIDVINLEKELLLPKFPLPKEFGEDADKFLEFLTWEGAKAKYKVLTPETNERIEFELSIIKKMGFAGYFLIVGDFVEAARRMDVFVGPGRGSAAGSVVAYCIGITNIDPIKYNLLFERFLNPERASMPDVDTDFDDMGRQKVIDYVVDKYGKNQVAHIVTYGTMAAKSSIKDVARVMDLPLAESNMLAKLVPDRPGTSLRRVLHAPIYKTDDSLEKKEELQAEDLQNIEKLRVIYDEIGTEQSIILHEAEKLEGTVRNVGIHASAIIIAPEELSGILPVCKNKEAELLVTQFDGNVIEKAGVIKMDFLGLKNLTILKDALKLIEQNHGNKIVLDDLPLDDVETYQLYQNGFTTGTFQFESAGMQKYLKELKPDRFEDLIAMNALYRPGPIAYIPNFINRKNGKEPIEYDVPEMAEILAETYGITTYQEQVMLLSQKLANFTKGDADVLRKAMGKKQRDVLDKMKPQFIAGCATNNHPQDKAEKIWKDWEAFAQYAFNKSHSTCYAMVAYQTMYLKAHYPSEYMAAVLNSQGNIERLSFYMEECRRMNLEILGPDINESNSGFSVNKNGQIRFGIGAIKGVGEAAVEDLLLERNTNGAFKNIFDMVKRVNSRTVNKKSLESMIQAGGFDSFTEMHRAQYFAMPIGETSSNLEKIIKYGQQFQTKTSESMNSLFGDLSETMEAAPPKLGNIEPWTLSAKLEKEKEVLGLYITAHPLDSFAFEMKYYKIGSIVDCKMPENLDKEFKLAGYVGETRTMVSKKGTNYMRTTIIDFTDQLEMMLFTQDYVNYSNYFEAGQKLLVTGKFQKGFGDDARVMFKISNVMLLEDVVKTFTKRIELKLEAANLQASLIQDLQQYIAKNTGGTALSIIIYDTKNQEQVNFKLNKTITFDQSLIELLEKYPEVVYRVEVS